MTSVKYFHSAMTDAPVLNGTAGSLIGVLDACLVNGFSLRTVDTLTVAANVATANISAGHGYEPDTIVLIAGATPAGLNGEKRVLTATTNTITFATPGIADQTATGTINARLAPAGWQKPFSGTNLAVYRSANIESTRTFYRVDASSHQDARAVGYESMTDVNTGTGPFPTNTQVSGGFWWPTASSTATTARPWIVIADDRVVYVFVNTATGGNFGDGYIWTFGDFVSYKSGDAYGCCITGNTSSIGTSGSAQTTSVNYVQASVGSGSGTYMPRSYTALGGAIVAGRVPESHRLSTAAYSGATASIAYPNGPDNGLVLSRLLICEPSGSHLRGVYPGILFAPHSFSTGQFSTFAKIDGTGTLAGRKLLALNCAGQPASGSATGSTTFFDITGPWR